MAFRQMVLGEINLNKNLVQYPVCTMCCIFFSFQRLVLVANRFIHENDRSCSNQKQFV